PRTLNTLAELPGEGYRFLQALNGGAVLQHAGVLEVWSARNAQPRLRQGFPSGWSPLALIPGGVLLHQPGDLRPVVAMGAESGGRTGSPIPPEPETRLSGIHNGRFRTGENALYLLSDAAVRKWSRPEAPDWTLPVAFRANSGEVAVLEAGPLVYFADSHRIWV